MKKLWEKDYNTNELLDRYTVGKDRELDLLLAPYDVIGSRAHAKMLYKVGLLEQHECDQLISGLNEIEKVICKK